MSEYIPHKFYDVRAKNRLGEENSSVIFVMIVPLLRKKL